MNGGISTIISFVTKYAGAGAEAAVSSIGKVSKACSLAARGAMSIASSLGSADSAFTKTARSALQLFTSIQQLGAIGGIIAGTQILIEKISEHFIQAAEEMVEKAREMGDRIREKLDKIKLQNGHKINLMTTRSASPKSFVVPNLSTISPNLLSSFLRGRESFVSPFS